MRLQQILYIIAIVVSFTMCTERHDRDVHTLLIDMNSTTFEPLIVRQATGECAIVDTMTADNNGVYIIDISPLQTGFYTLQATDSVRIMDIVLCEDFPIACTSNNASSKRDIVGTAVLAILPEKRRYIHIEALLQHAPRSEMTAPTVCFIIHRSSHGDQLRT